MISLIFAPAVYLDAVIDNHCLVMAQVKEQIFVIFDLRPTSMHRIKRPLPE